MGLFGKNEVMIDPKVEKRARLVPTSEVGMWLDTTIGLIGVEQRSYQRSGEDHHLKEAIVHAETVLSMLRVLEERSAG